MKKFWQQTTRFIVLAIFTLTFTLTCTPNSVGQIPLLTTPSNNQPPQSPPWDLSEVLSTNASHLVGASYPTMTCSFQSKPWE